MIGNLSVYLQSPYPLASSRRSGNLDRRNVFHDVVSAAVTKTLHLLPDRALCDNRKDRAAFSQHQLGGCWYHISYRDFQSNQCRTCKQFQLHYSLYATSRNKATSPGRDHFRPITSKLSHSTKDNLCAGHTRRCNVPSTRFYRQAAENGHASLNSKSRSGCDGDLFRVGVEVSIRKG